MIGSSKSKFIAGISQLHYQKECCQAIGSNVTGSSNTAVMVRYVCSLDNMRILMNLLRDSNKTIQVEAFHVFKLFPANQRKPLEIVNVLVANRSKLFGFLVTSI